VLPRRQDPGDRRGHQRGAEDADLPGAEPVGPARGRVSRRDTRPPRRTEPPGRGYLGAMTRPGPPAHGSIAPPRTKGGTVTRVARQQNRSMTTRQGFLDAARAVF